MDSSDQQLLGRFAKDGDEAAFTELVRRYLSLVHSSALRLTGNAAAAQDIAQAVFIKLARERLPAEVPLPAWLHRTCRSAAIEWIRSETRRKRREEISAAAHAMTTPPSAWKDISPLLDEVIDQLPLKERHVILGRYIMGKSYAEICSGTGLIEDAARMCGNRALDRMRQLLAKRGVATSAAALGLSLPAHALVPVAPAFISSVSVLALSSTAPAAAMSFTSLKIIAMTYKSTLLVSAAVILLLGAGAVAVYQHSPPEAAIVTPAATAANGLSANGAGDAPMPAKAPRPVGNRPGDPAAEKKQDAGHEAGLREMQRDQRIESRILALTTRLNLAPQQVTAIRQAMNKADRDRAALRQNEAVRRRAGTNDPAAMAADLAGFASIQESQEAGIATALSAEQLAAYEQYQQEYQQAQASIWANQQVGTLQTMLDLTEQQQDSVYQLLSRQAAGYDVSETLAQGGEAAKAFEEQSLADLPATLQGMQQILTAQQLQLYQTQMQQRAALMQK